MHIPDGYLGPPTSGALFAVMIPLWIAAARIVKQTLRTKQVPLLAIGAAFSFVLMMFNVPIPGGSTGHAVGGVLVAILLGPWAAMIAITVALVIQALLFGDGGILAFGANCFNMAVVLPFVGYGVYRLLRGSTPRDSRHGALAAGIAGYVGIVAASLFAGVEFGLQPLLHHTAEGQALYCPYGLKFAVPAMVGQHLLVFGWIEATVTAFVVKYLWVHEPELLESGRDGFTPSTGTSLWLRRPTDRPPHSSGTYKFWILLAVLALLSPLGLLLPRFFRSGTAWGEWNADELGKMLGYVPHGIAGQGAQWNAPLPNYMPQGWEEKGVLHLSLAYLLTAFAGMGLIVCIAWLIGRRMATPALGPGRAGAAVVRVKCGEQRRAARTSGDFVARSIQGALAFLKDAVFSEDAASLPGLMQSLDPRFKLAGILLLLLATMFTRSLAVLGLLYLLCLLLAVLSHVRLGFFLVRTWVFIPLFSLGIAIPALFSFVSPGETIASIGIFHVTQTGLHAAAIFLGRVVVSVSLAVLLNLTTRHTALLRALRAFAVPQVFVLVLGICYRYIYLFVELVENTYRAIRSRTGARLHHRQGQRIVAWNIGQLWSRSYALNEQVYGAMVSRGFRGEPVTLEPFPAQPRDWVWLGGVAIVCTMLMVWL